MRNSTFMYVQKHGQELEIRRRSNSVRSFTPTWRLHRTESDPLLLCWPARTSSMAARVMDDLLAAERVLASDCAGEPGVAADAARRMRAARGGAAREVETARRHRTAMTRQLARRRTSVARGAREGA